MGDVIMEDRDPGFQRNALQVMANILKVSVNNASENELAASTNLNSKFIRKYVEFLNEKQFIEIAEKSKVYVITGRGRDFLDNFEKLNRLLITQDMCAPEVSDFNILLT
jgi:predicted transcriptional regulator